MLISTAFVVVSRVGCLGVSGVIFTGYSGFLHPDMWPPNAYICVLEGISISLCEIIEVSKVYTFITDIITIDIVQSFPMGIWCQNDVV